MAYVVLDTDVLSSASARGSDRRARLGWELIQGLIRGRDTLLVCPGLMEEYRRVRSGARAKLANYAFTEAIKPESEPDDPEGRDRLIQLGVDESDANWVLLAAKHEAVFVTWEKHAPRRARSEQRGRKHQQVASAVEAEFGVRIWNPRYAMKRLCTDR